MSKLRGVLLFESVVPEVEEGLIYRDKKPAEEVDEDQEQGTGQLHGTTLRRLQQGLRHH